MVLPPNPAIDQSGYRAAYSPQPGAGIASVLFSTIRKATRAPRSRCSRCGRRRRAMHVTPAGIVCSGCLR